MDDSVSIIDIMQDEEKPKRGRRGRPPKAPVEGGESEAPKTRARRTSKVTAEQVVNGVVQCFGLVAVVTKRAHWQVSPDEVKPWSSEAAKLLNSIPSTYVNSAINASGYVAVGFGLYSISAPRIALDAKLKAIHEAVETNKMSEQDANAQIMGLYAAWTGTQPD